MGFSDAIEKASHILEKIDAKWPEEKARAV
jgi:hypothetical protein